MKRLLSIIIIMGVIALIFVGCSNSSSGTSESLLIGKWAATSTSFPPDLNTVEFFKDGTVVFNGSTSAQYRLLDDTRLDITGGFNFVCQFSVSKDQLTLEYSGMKAVYNHS